VPENPATGVNNTSPDVGFTEKEPLPAIVSDVLVQFGAVSDAPHNKMLLAFNPVPESFEIGVNVI
jgi:hypothetical protein